MQLAWSGYLVAYEIMALLCHWSRFVFLYTSTIYLLHELAYTYVTEENTLWLAGYQLIFFVISVRSLIGCFGSELCAILQSIRELQYSSLCTTSQGEAFAFYRERKLSSCNNSDLSGEQDPIRLYFTQCGQQNTATVFWPTVVSLMIIYNTVHLTLSPLPETSPLFFGAPAFVIYLITYKIISIFVHEFCCHVVITALLIFRSLFLIFYHGIYFSLYYFFMGQ